MAALKFKNLLIRLIHTAEHELALASPPRFEIDGHGIAGVKFSADRIGRKCFYSAEHDIQGRTMLRRMRLFARLSGYWAYRAVP
jgi:hypothetical protein